MRKKGRKQRTTIHQSLQMCWGVNCQQWDGGGEILRQDGIGDWLYSGTPASASPRDVKMFVGLAWKPSIGNQTPDGWMLPGVVFSC